MSYSCKKYSREENRTHAHRHSPSSQWRFNMPTVQLKNSTADGNTLNISRVSVAVRTWHVCACVILAPRTIQPRRAHTSSRYMLLLCCFVCAFVRSYKQRSYIYTYSYIESRSHAYTQCVYISCIYVRCVYHIRIIMIRGAQSRAHVLCVVFTLELTHVERNTKSVVFSVK